MFTLVQSLDLKVKEEIYDHFVTHNLQKQQDLQRLSNCMLCDFQNVQNQEPNFILGTLLPNIDRWNLKRFQLIWVNKLKRKVEPKKKRKQLNILKLISHIDFTQLTYLNLNNLNLNTIQPLTHMKLQKLETLYAQFSQITSLKPLSKIYLPKLSYLACEHNYYIDEEYKYFTRMYFGNKSIHLRSIPQGHGIYFSIKKHLFKLDHKYAFQNLIQFTFNDYDHLYKQVMSRKFQ